MMLGPGISYYNGKGTTRAAAHAGALMEAIERHAGERYDGQVIAASHYNLRRRARLCRPARNPRPDGPQIQRASDAGMGAGLRPDDPPADICAAELRGVALQSGFRRMALFHSSTNGLASGNTRVDAICHALVRGDRTGCDGAGDGKGRRQTRRRVTCWRISGSTADCRRSGRPAADIASRIAPSAQRRWSANCSAPGSRWNFEI